MSKQETRLREIMQWVRAFDGMNVFHSEGQRPGGFFYRTNSTDSLFLLDALLALADAVEQLTRERDDLQKRVEGFERHVEREIEPHLLQWAKQAEAQVEKLREALQCIERMSRPLRDKEGAVTSGRISRGSLHEAARIARAALSEQTKEEG